MSDLKGDTHGIEPWPVRRLSDLVVLPSGQVSPLVEPYSEMTLVAPDHVESRTGRLLARESAREQGAISGKYAFATDDVVYSKIRPYLRKAYLAEFDGICSADMYPLRPSAELDSRFLLHTLLDEDFSRFAESVSMRTGIPKLNRSEFEEYCLRVPPVDEQRRIADKIDDVDRAMHVSRATIDQLMMERIGLVRDLLCYGVDEAGRLRNPGNNPSALRHVAGRVLLQGWERVALGTLCRVRRGASPRPIDDPRWFSSNGPGWIRIADVTRSRGQLTVTTQHLSEEGVRRSVRVHPGQVIMSIAATVGLPIIVGTDACIHDGFVVFDRHEETLDTTFLVTLLTYMTPEFVRQGQTGTQANINTDIVGRSIVSVPPILEQVRIAAILVDFDKLLGAEQSIYRKLGNIKRGILADLLTGRVRVPAEVAT